MTTETKKKPTKERISKNIIKPLSNETAELIKNTSLEFLTEEEGILLNRALKNSAARTKAIDNLKKYQLFF